MGGAPLGQMTTPVELVLSRLQGVKKTHDGWMAKCPAHEDRVASLSIAEGKNGCVLLKCFAGCEFARILAAIGLSESDTFPQREGGANGEGRQILAIYDYTDETKHLLFQVVRFAPKDFRQRRPDGNGGWIWKLDNTRRVLYHLPAVIAAVKAGETVFVVEGEKDVHALEAWGLVATTAAGGAGKGKWHSEYSEALKGASVVCLPDNDEPGREYMQHAAESLRGKGAMCTVLDLAVDWKGMPARGDVSDLIAAGGGKDYLLALVADAQKAQAPKTLEIYTAQEFADMTPERPEYLVWGYVARGAVTEVAAKIKAGKTTWVLQLCRAVIAGEPFLDCPTHKCRVLYLTEERRPTFKTALQRVGLTSGSDFHILLRQMTNGGDWPATADAVLKECRARKIGLLVVDTLGDWADLVGDAENDAGAALAAMRPVQDMAAAGIGVICCRHERKGGGELGESARGSTAFGGVMDVLVSLRRVTGRGHETRREVAAVSRFDETPVEMLIELRGDHYVSLGDSAQVATEAAERLIFDHLPTSRVTAMTADAIYAVVKEVEDVGRSTVHEALKRLGDDHLIGRERGAGNAPRQGFGCWLPSGQDEEQEEL
jgi:hypothetical protein